VAVQFELGKYQLVVDGKLETATIGRYECNGFDLRLKLVEQLGYQTGSMISVVSDSTVNQVEFHQHPKPPLIFQ
jgi:hypothetical protein